ncbi:beta-1,3-galactosyltransferase 2-like isoform X2 [Gouania willdenowi]|uniref:beta-1,3-galactosyltransferase 2-like isoform X2 n=1 Tax=Gouania willdenowi TaxID=441366 RepID=UPI0010569B97|nr:beta-1,3-galactosyltransferase 2-like isoform X2 [Gouania willdenowi]
MPKNCKCAKPLGIKVRCWWLLLILFFLMGLAIFIFYSLDQQASWPMNPWRIRSLSNQSYIDVTTSVDSYFVEYPHPYQFLMDEPNRCQEESPFLVLIIPVEPHNQEARNIIRNTWGKETMVLGHVVSHYFLLGLSTEGYGTKAFQEELLLESQRHHDILQSNFVDSYKNLTIKTMVMFEWLSTHCSNTSYAMKIDSDIFLNVQKLVDLLLKAPRQHYMTGHVD